MFSLFNTTAVAFIVALALYEAYQFAWAHHHRATTDHRIKRCIHTNNMFIDRSATSPNGAQVALSIQRTYMSRSLVFHQYNALKSGMQPSFKSLPYFGIGAMGAVMFVAAGLPVLTALGIGVVGGIAAFVSKQGRDFACFSDEMSERDDAVQNLSLVLINERRAH